MDSVSGSPCTKAQLEHTLAIGKKTTKQICMFDPNTGHLVNGIVLTPYSSIGYSNNPLTSCVSSPNDELIIFPTSCRIAVYDINNENIIYLDSTFDSSSLSYIACGIHPKNGPIVAFAEEPTKDNNAPYVIIETINVPRKIYKIDHRHIKLLSNENLVIQQILIPSGSKYMVTLAQLSSTKRKHISYFITSKERFLTSVDARCEICHIDICPTDNNIIVACGLNYLHYFNLQDKDLKEDKVGIVSLSIEKENNFIDARFLVDSTSIIVASEQNKIYLINKKEILTTYNVEFLLRESIQLDSNSLQIRPIDDILNGNSSEEKVNHQNALSPSKTSSKINVLSVTKNTITIGSKEGSFVLIFEIRKESEIHFSKSYNLGNAYLEIVSLCSRSNHVVIAAKKCNKIEEIIEENNEELEAGYTLNIILFASVFNVDANINQNIRHIQPLENTFGPITKISLGISRNVMVCLSKNQIIRVAEYKNDLRQIAKCDHFHSIAYDVSIHPMGFQFAVGTKEGVEIFLILEGEIKLMSTIEGKPTHCLEYSRGGHYLAAGMGMVVMIIDPYSQEIKYKLMNHTAPIKYLHWVSNDSQLISACSGGSIFGWVSRFEYHVSEATNDDIGKAEIIKAILANRLEYQNKNAKFTGVDYDEEFDLLITCTAEKKLVISIGHGTNTYLEVDLNPCTPCCILLAKKIQFLLIGTSTGNIRAYLWPINRSRKVEFLEFKVHSKAITSIVLSTDYQKIFSCSEDGSVFGCKVSDVIGEVEGLSSILAKKRQSNELGTFKTQVHFDSLTMIYKNTITQKLEEIKSLDDEIKEKEENTKLEIQKLEKNYELLMAQLNSDNMKRIDDEKNRYKKLQDDYEQERKALQKLIEETKEDARRNEDEMEKSNQEKLKKAYANHEDLIRTLDDTKLKFKKEVEDILEKNKDVLNSLQKEHQTKYDDLLKKYNDLVKDMKKDRMKFDEMLEQCEQEYEKEINKRNKESEAKLFEERKLQEELTKKKDESKKELEEKTKLLVKSEEESRAYKEEKEKLEIEALKKNEELIKIQEQLGEREEIIRNKEKAINELKLSNQHLENFRFVLDHKICSLKDEKSPMESQIKNLEDQISKMFNELEEESLNKKKLLLGVDELKIKFNNAKQQLAKREDEVRASKRKFELLQFELATLMKESDFALWPKTLSEIYRNYFEDIHSGPVTDPHIWKSDNSTNNQKLQDVANLKLREELIRQKEWTHQKLVKVVQQNDKLKKDKKNYVIQMQIQNTELINECNTLRHENHIVAKRISTLEKKFKELTGISITNAQDIEKKLETMLKQISTKKLNVTEPKDTPYVKKLKDNGVSARNKTILEYYSKLYSGQDNGEDHENVQGLLGDLEKNKQALSKQNEEIQKLQQKVNQFLLNSEASQEASTLPPITKSHQQLSNTMEIESQSKLEEIHTHAKIEPSMSLKKQPEEKNLTSQSTIKPIVKDQSKQAIKKFPSKQ